ncbi:MAG: MATE family efflux transporter [Clostridia bacterium]|nr:MATE family efflux transporter [Clostridia bacterium]
MFTKKRTLDMTQGPLFSQIMFFALPVMLSSILQLLFNSADLVVVGNFAGSECIAAVGATGSLVALLVSTFIGLSVGTAVLTAQYLGARNHEGVHKVVHTSMLLAIIIGIFVGIIGLFFSRNFLLWMDTPEDVLELSTLYLTIYFLGTPGSMIYNFGAAILRSNGDTKRPLYYLTVAGFANIVLNLICVAVFKMDVAGVAIATVVSQYISAILVVMNLCQIEGSCRLTIKSMRFYPSELWSIIKVGLPAAIQSSLYSISNVLIQSSVNYFGTAVLSGNTAGGNVEGYVNVSQSAFHQSALVFAGQNLGAHNYKRSKKVLWAALGSMTIVSLSLTGIVLLFRYPLLGLFITNDPEALEYGVIRLFVVCSTEFFCGFHDVICGELRGLGRTIGPMAMCLMGICGVRIIWIYTIFQEVKTYPMLLACYPVSWVITSIVALVYFMIVAKKMPNTDGDLEKA